MFESGTYINPFKIPDLPAELVHFATGSVSTPDIQKSLVEAFNKSKSMADTFAKEWLIFSEEQTPKKSNYDTINTPNIMKMAAMNKIIKIRNKTISEPGELVYLQLLAINDI